MVNRLDNINIKQIEIVRIDTDKFYEVFTVRIFASCFDYVENKKAKLIGGSKRKNRLFSEYWTFIRKSGIETDDNNVNLQVFK